MAVFLAVFRMFIIVQLELLRGHTSAPRPMLMILFGTFFGFYATIDSAAAFEREMHIFRSQLQVPIILSTEISRIYMDTGFVIVAFVYLVLAGVMCDRINFRRFIFIGLLTVTAGSVTIVTQVWFVLKSIAMYSMAPGIFFASVHMSLAAAALFLLHLDDGKKYEGLKEGEDDHRGLDIERASSNGGEDGFAEDGDV
jgi:hypothetical protein